MAFIARSSFDVPFGRKGQLFEMMKKYEKLEEEVGFPKLEVLVGSIGAPESRVEINHFASGLSSNGFVSSGSAQAAPVSPGSSQRSHMHRPTMSTDASVEPTAT